VAPELDRLVITNAEIVALYHARSRNRQKWVTKANEICRIYNYEFAVPLPELDAMERPGIANLVAQGIDQTAQRVASVLPDIIYPPLRPGIEKSEGLARQRRLATLAWWDMNGMPNLLRQRARFLIGYGHSPVVLRPVSPKIVDRRKIPFWRVYNPLVTFLPEPQYLGDIEPEDGIFLHTQSLAWLQDRYPDAARRLEKGPNPTPDSRFEILEYLDCDVTVMLVCGKPPVELTRQTWGMTPTPTGSPHEQLERVANRSGICPVVAPGRITLDRMMGMFDGLPQMYEKQAKLDALEYIGIKRGIFPEQWAVTHPTAPSAVRIVTPADAERGVVGEIQGGQMQTLPINPGVQTPQAIDRLERNQRVTAGIPSEYGGESPTNIRTARRGAAVLSSTIDMPIGELQDIFAASLEAENVRAVAMMKANYGSRTTSFYLPRSGQLTRKDYTPNTAFETDWHVVKYSIPGADAAALPIELGQRIGTSEMSLQTAREIDPMIEDPIRERNQVELEGLRHSILAGLEQQAAQGKLPATTIARIAQIRGDDPALQLEDAVMLAHADTQAQQAAQQPGAPPEQQPGIAPQAPINAQGEQGAPAPPGQAVAPPPGSGAHLEQLLQGLRRGARQGPAEKALSA
jgi:hypothetical protein